MFWKKSVRKTVITKAESHILKCCMFRINDDDDDTDQFGQHMAYEQKMADVLLNNGPFIIRS